VQERERSYKLYFDDRAAEMVLAGKGLMLAFVEERDATRGKECTRGRLKICKALIAS
jgi:hypothetical protein